MTSLRLGKLPDRSPVKVMVAMPPDLRGDLDDYAAVYRATYGVDEPVTELIPHMLRAFLASDRLFAQKRRDLRKGGSNV